MTRLDDARAELLSLQNIPDEPVPTLWEPAYYGNLTTYNEAYEKTFETINRNKQKNNKISVLSSEISQLVKSKITDLEKQLEYESNLLTEYSKTRDFYKSGIKYTVTIANIEDIQKKQAIVADLQKRIDNIINPPPQIIVPVAEVPPPPIIEDKPNIIPNINDQLGNSLEPISKQIQKPENKGLILAAGLVAAAVLLK